MTTIDQRIVDMQFNNQKFEQNARQTIDTVGKLDKSLKFDGVGKGLEGLQANVQNISSKFSAFGAVGFTVLQNLTNAALNAGKTIVGSVLNPIIEGGKRRALNIEQATFALNGLAATSDKLAKVDGKLKKNLSDKKWVALIKENAMAAVDGTAFGFDAAAKAASQLAASNVKAGDDMTSALRGISGLAAQTGSSYEDMAMVFTKVAGQGRLMGDDLNRIGVRGVNAAATLAKAFNVTEAEMRKLVSEGKIDFQTFANVMNDTFGDNAMKANETFSGAMSNVNAALARIGETPAAAGFEALRQIFVKLIPVINSVNKVLKPFFQSLFGENKEKIAGMIKPITDFLEAITFDPADASKNGKLGQEFRTIIENIVDTFVHAGEIVGKISSVIGNAFSSIFPDANLFQSIKDFSDNLWGLMVKLKPTGVQLAYIGNIAKGVFSVFSIGAEVVKKLFGVVKTLFGEATKGQNFLKPLSDIGLWLEKLNDKVKNGEEFAKFFDDLTAVLKKPIEPLKQLGAWFVKIMGEAWDAVYKFFNGFEGLNLGTIMSNIRAFFDSFGKKSEEGTSKWETFGKVFSKIWEIISPVAQKIGDIFLPLIDKIVKSFSNLGVAGVSTAVSWGGLMLIFGNVYSLIDNLNNISLGKSGFLNSLAAPFRTLTANLKMMQVQLKAEIIKSIAVSLLILAVALLVLSTINPVDLTVAMIAVKVMITELMAALAVFDKLAGKKQIGDITSMAFALILLSLAVLILASAVKKLSSLSWEELAKGVVAVGALLGALVLFTKFAKVSKGSMAQAAGLILLATAINILASAASKFAAMSVKELVKGIGSIGVLLTMLMGFANLAGGAKKMVSIGLGMIAISQAMIMMADAVGKFGGMNLETLAKGIGSIGAALLVIAGVMHLMPKDLLIKAVALTIVAAALIKLQQAMASFGGMSWDELIHAFVGMGGALLIIAGAMYLMAGAIPGAIALTIVAAALSMLVPALMMFGSMSWEDMGKSLLMLAGTFLVIGVAGLVLIPVVPVLMALGIAFILMGAGAALAGAGIFLFATGLLALAGAGAGAAVGLTVMVSALIGLIPMAMKAIGQGLIEIVKTIAASGEAIYEAITTVILALCEAIDKAAPKVIDTLFKLVMKLVDALLKNVPKLVDSGLKLVQGILDGVAKNISKITETALEIVSEFIDGIAEGLPGVVDSAANLIIEFVNGLANTIDSKAEEMGRAGGRLAMAIINGMVKGITGGIDEIVKAAKKMANDALNAAKKALGIASPSKKFEEIGQFVNEGFAAGIRGGIPISEVLKSEIAEAFDDLKSELDQLVKDTDKAVTKAKTKLNKTKKGTKKRKKAKTALDNAKKEAAQAKKAQAELDKLRKAEEANLEKLSKAYYENAAALDAANQLLEERADYLRSVKNQYDAMPDMMSSRSQTEVVNKLAEEYNALTQQVNDAEQALYDIKNAMKDSARSIKDQYSSLGSFNQDTKFEDYVKEIQNRIEATAKMRQDLVTLRSMGIDDETYAAIVAQGIDAQPFIDQLLASGTDGLRQLKDLYAKLGAEAGYLGETVSSELYQAGIDSAQAIADGLKAEQEASRNSIDSASGNYVEGFADDIRKQIADNKELADDLLILKKMGLSDRAYKELVSKGMSAQPFIKDLISKGGSAVKEVNSLLSDLETSADTFATAAATAMYDAGAQTAQGLVDGLKAKEADLIAQMDKLAGTLVSSLKKQLGIKSPSREFMKIAAFAADGLISGFDKSTIDVERASENVGDSAMDALRRAISDVGAIVSAEMDTNPQIKPVLDLSDVRKQAGLIDDLLTPSGIDVSNGYLRAHDVARVNTQRVSDQAVGIDASGPSETVVFNQNNYSPKALTTAEIYRQTKNITSVYRRRIEKNESARS